MKAIMVITSIPVSHSGLPRNQSANHTLSFSMKSVSLSIEFTEKLWPTSHSFSLPLTGQNQLEAKVPIKIPDTEGTVSLKVPSNTLQR